MSNNELWGRTGRIKYMVNGARTIIPFGVMVFDLTSKTLRIGDGCTCGGVGYIPVIPTCPAIPEEVMEKAEETQAKMDAEQSVRAVKVN